ITQLKQRDIPTYDDPRDMRQELAASLKVSAPQAGTLVLETTTADSLRAIDLLESLGRAYKGFSMTQARMTDSNAASVTIHRVAARDKAPVRDDRLMIGSATFG